MGYPSGKEKAGGCGFKIQGVAAVYGIKMQKIAAMVQSHYYHYQSAKQIDGLNAGFGFSWCIHNKANWKTNMEEQWIIIRNVGTK
jgi:hypothetical protein